MGGIVLGMVLSVLVVFGILYLWNAGYFDGKPPIDPKDLLEKSRAITRPPPMETRAGDPLFINDSRFGGEEGQ